MIFDALQLFFLLLTTSVVGIYLYSTRNFNYWQKRGIRTASAINIPFLGNVASCIFGDDNPNSLLAKFYQMGKNEKFLGFYVLNQPYLMVRDPDLIKDIFVRDFGNFTNKIIGTGHHDPLGDQNLFLVDNPPWKFIRNKLTPVFTSGKMKNMLGLMLQVRPSFDSYMESLGINENNPKTFNVVNIAALLMTDIIGIIAFGMDFRSLTDPEAEFRKHGSTLWESTFRRYVEMLSIIFVPGLRPLTKPKFFSDRSTDFFRQSFWKVINHRMESGERKHDLIDILIELKKKQENDPDDAFKLEGDALVAQAAIFFSGGFETSSTTVSFILYELAKNPGIQSRLRRDVLEAIEKDNGEITYDMVMNLPYLNMVFLEGLRLYPILPWLDRIPQNSYQFADSKVVVEGGVPCILPMRAMHMDPEYFPDPEKFDPERFSQKNKAKIRPFTFFPFGEGPRNCIAMRLGHMQVKLGVIFFISKYEVKPCPMTNIPIKLDPRNNWVHSINGMPLNLTKISSPTQ